MDGNRSVVAGDARDVAGSGSELVISHVVARGGRRPALVFAELVAHLVAAVGGFGGPCGCVDETCVPGWNKAARI